MYASLQVVTLALKHRMIQLYHFDVDVARSHIDELIGSVLVLDVVTIRGTFLDPDHEAVDAVSECFTFTDVARCSLDLTRACTFVALTLELLHHTRCNLLPLDNHTRASATVALRDIIRVICAATTTVGADNIPVVL